jgi:hypothetical protein
MFATFNNYFYSTMLVKFQSLSGVLDVCNISSPEAVTKGFECLQCEDSCKNPLCQIPLRLKIAIAVVNVCRNRAARRHFRGSPGIVTIATILALQIFKANSIVKVPCCCLLFLVEAYKYGRLRNGLLAPDSFNALDIFIA